MPFVHHTTARFHQVDRAGIAFFACAFEYAHDCFDEILIAAFDDPNLDKLGFGMPLVHAEASYKRPIRLYDRLELRATIERQGERSVTFRYDVVGDDDVLRCVVHLRHAFVAFPEFVGRSVPDHFIERMQALGLIGEHTSA